MVLLVLILLATERVFNKNYLIALLEALEEEVGNIFYLNKHPPKLFSCAIESKLQRVHAYVGHPVNKYPGQKNVTAESLTYVRAAAQMAAWHNAIVCYGKGIKIVPSIINILSRRDNS